jgi:hypothetical protein
MQQCIKLPELDEKDDINLNKSPLPKKVNALQAQSIKEFIEKKCIFEHQYKEYGIEKNNFEKSRELYNKYCIYYDTFRKQVVKYDIINQSNMYSHIEGPILGYIKFNQVVRFHGYTHPDNVQKTIYFNIVSKEALEQYNKGRKEKEVQKSSKIVNDYVPPQPSLTVNVKSKKKGKKGKKGQKEDDRLETDRLENMRKIKEYVDKTYPKNKRDTLNKTENTLLLRERYKYSIYRSKIDSYWKYSPEELDIFVKRHVHEITMGGIVYDLRIEGEKIYDYDHDEDDDDDNNEKIQVCDLSPIEKVDLSKYHTTSNNIQSQTFINQVLNKY